MSPRSIAGLAAGLLLCVGLSPALAAPFSNGSFETPVITAGNVEPWAHWFPPDTYLVGTDGWITRVSAFATSTGHSGGVVINDSNTVPGPASHGDQFFALASHNQPGSIEQTFDTVPGTTYEVTWSHAYLTPGPPVPHTANYNVTAPGASAIYTVTAGTSQPFGTTNFAPAATFSFIATGSSSTLKFEAQQAYGNGYYGAAIDNVVVTALPIPEPGSMSLVALGAAALLRRRR